MRGILKVIPVRGMRKSPNKEESRETVLAIASKLGLEPLVAEQIVGRGFVNEVWRVRALPMDVVIRLNHDREAQAVLAEYEMEATCYRVAAGGGMASPRILGTGLHRNRAYLAAEFVPGIAGDDHANRLDAWRRLGACGAAIHRLPVPPEPWRIFPLLARGSDDEWSSQRRLNLDALSSEDPLVGLGVYHPDEIDRLRQLFESLPDGPVGLCHGDLAPRNLIFSDSGDTVVLDWGCANVHLIPFYDLEGLLRNHLLENAPTFAELTAFAEGYGWSPDEFAAIRTLAEAYLLLKSFDLVRWALARCPERLDEVTKRATLLWSTLRS